MIIFYKTEFIKDYIMANFMEGRERRDDKGNKFFITKGLRRICQDLDNQIKEVVLEII